MGYYTRFSLSIIEGDEFLNYADEISNHSDYSDPFGEPCKWYDMEKDMQRYSKTHPKTVFKIHGEGEESTDIWDRYFLNGKMQLCNTQIITEPFDKSKLA